MTAEEIQIEISKTCGWSDVKWSEANNSFIGVAPIDWQKRNPISKLSSKFRVPKYTEESDAALEFARQLASEGWRAEAGMGTDGTWECTFYKEASAKTHADNKGKREGVVTEEHYGAGDTLALAICEAGLRAKGLWRESALKNPVAATE